MKTILIAGTTGLLGGKMVQQLLKKEVRIRAVLRPQKDRTVVDRLTQQGIDVCEVDMTNLEQMTEVCQGADCVLSVLSGLDDVVNGVQRTLLHAAVAAGVPRFIPSDFSIDFRNLVPGRNRNLDFRKQFYEYVNRQPIQATTIFTGALMDLIKTDMPLIIKKKKRILCWGNPEQKMEFTHTDDIAAFTAAVCLDDTSPRHLFIAGSVLSCNDFVSLLSTLTGTRYKLFRPGGIWLLNFAIGLTKFFKPDKDKLYPVWQGMQYMRDMMEGRVALQTDYSNNRYGSIPFKPAEVYLTEDGWVKE